MSYISKLIYSRISNQFELKHVDNEPNVCTRPFWYGSLKVSFTLSDTIGLLWPQIISNPFSFKVKDDSYKVRTSLPVT